MAEEQNPPRPSVVEGAVNAIQSRLQARLDALKSTAPAEAEAPPPPALDEAEESRKRLAFILAYVKKTSDNPILQQKEVVFKVMAEERAYQERLCVRLAEGQQQLPPPAAAMGLTPEEIAVHPVYHDLEARRAALAAELAKAREVVQRLLKLQREVSGTRPLPAMTGPLPEQPPREAIALLEDWLAENHQ